MPGEPAPTLQGAVASGGAIDLRGGSYALTLVVGPLSVPPGPEEARSELQLGAPVTTTNWSQPLRTGAPQTARPLANAAQGR